MKRTLRTVAFMRVVAAHALLLWAAAIPAQAQSAGDAGMLRVESVTDDLHLIRGEGGNVAVLVTNDGVLLVDNMFHRNHDDILVQVASVSDQPITHVLNTHQHDDHAGGNHRMAAVAEVIAHRNVWLNLSDIQQPYYEDTPGTPIGLPQVTFTDALFLHLGGQEVQALHFGRGHTSGDAVVYFPDLGVIHAGDLFPYAGTGIYVDYAQGGSFLEWSATLDAVLELDFELVITGHGPVLTKADLVEFLADLTAMRDRITALIRMGANKGQVVAVFERDYGWRATGCPPSPPTPGCLQYQQIDALIEELSAE